MFVRNTWYVVAWSGGLEAGALQGVRVLGEPIVVYRTADGRPVALHDRCRHRAAPLSMGRVEGDTLRCLYHGFRYAPSGACVEIPGQPAVPPLARVVAYPVAERHGWTWVWMGDPARADPELIPHLRGPGDGSYVLKPGVLDFDADQPLVCDNLLDFTHLSYVHTNSFGVTEDWARGRPTFEVLERSLKVRRWVRDQPAPNHQNELGRIDYWVAYEFTVPGILSLEFQLYPVGAADRHAGGVPGDDPSLISASYSLQAATPTADGACRYFFAYGPRTEEDVDGYAEAFAQVQMTAFLEDKAIIEAQHRELRHGGAEDLLAVTSDAALVRYRRVVARLAEAENTPEGDAAHLDLQTFAQ